MNRIQIIKAIVKQHKDVEGVALETEEIIMGILNYTRNMNPFWKSMTTEIRDGAKNAMRNLQFTGEGFNHFWRNCNKAVGGNLTLENFGVRRANWKKLYQTAFGGV